MKQFISGRGWKAVLAAILTLVFAVATVSSLTLSYAEGYDQVASKSDMTTVEEVGVEGMEPIALSKALPCSRSNRPTSRSKRGRAP